MKINKKGYSVVISLLLIGFMLVLSTGILRLILNEMKNNKAMGDYIKSYAGAESAQELALLAIKKYGYGYVGEISNTMNPKSVILTENYLNPSLYNKNSDVLISYLNDGKVNSYEGTLSALGYDIIPLFYIDDTGEQKVTDITLSVPSGMVSDLSWNIVGSFNGISGKGDNLSGFKKTFTSDGFRYTQETVGSFLVGSSTNYLVLFNSGNSVDLVYSLNTIDPTEYFTKPSLNIISTGEVGDYKQNLNTNVDNTEFLNILKYSIYSN